MFYQKKNKIDGEYNDCRSREGRGLFRKVPTFIFSATDRALTLLTPLSFSIFYAVYFFATFFMSY